MENKNMSKKREIAPIDINDMQSIIRFGSAAQAELQTISQQMLQDVRNKDVGPAGDSLQNMVRTIKAFSISDLNPDAKRSWWGKIVGKTEPLVAFMEQYEDVQTQIDAITDELLDHEMELLQDVKALDQLYNKTHSYYLELSEYITVGDTQIKDINENILPAMQKAFEELGDSDDQLIEAQELRDLRGNRDDLERRVHDLKLTRQVTMQSLPSIRLVQENDKSLVAKINATLVNTVPLWETQLAQAVTIQRSREAALIARDANDLTNELLKSNAGNLKLANKAVREEMERGVFDMEAIKQANMDLIETVEDSLRIADEGRKKRAEAEIELTEVEHQLRTALIGNQQSDVTLEQAHISQETEQFGATIHNDDDDIVNVEAEEESVS